MPEAPVYLGKTHARRTCNKRNTPAKENHNLYWILPCQWIQIRSALYRRSFRFFPLLNITFYLKNLFFFPFLYIYACCLLLLSLPSCSAEWGGITYSNSVKWWRIRLVSIRPIEFRLCLVWVRVNQTRLACVLRECVCVWVPNQWTLPPTRCQRERPQSNKFRFRALRRVSYYLIVYI